jgi:hypothetical protein
MKVNYKGFEINVTKEPCMAGYDLIYRSIFRVEDGYEFWSDFSEDESPIKEHVSWMKGEVDEYLKDPEQYEKDRNE